jgi:predicted AAA+ superfamily ATPase
VEYQVRLVDGLLDELQPLLPALALDGAKAVGKTATAQRRAASVFALDRTAARAMVEADPEVVLTGAPPTLVDEWQLVPEVWDTIRRAVDSGAAPGQFLLAGSATVPPGTRIHSGAGRIVRVLMRPLTVPERGLAAPSVSFSELLAGKVPAITGATEFSTADYAEEALASGFPGIRAAPSRARRALLDGYVDHVVEHDIPQADGVIRNPAALRAWLAAYGAATATSASYAKILAAATPGDSGNLSRDTARNYRDVLERVRVLDPLPAWVPSFAHIKRLAQGPKHHLVDPALAARLVGSTREGLLRGEGEPDFPRDGTFMGALFESLAVQTLRVLAELNESRAFHLRTTDGRQEVDVIIQRPDLRVLAIEVKLSTAVRPADVTHLNWLETQIPGRVVDKILINTGRHAYRRPDGVAVVPLVLLGP